MKTELRIGNWITRKDIGNGRDRIEQILELGERVMTTGPIKYICDYGWVWGIPLTEEWLLKAGYEKEKAYYQTPYYLIERAMFGDNRWSIRKKITEETSLFLRYLNFVHEWQNVYFSLESKELTFKH